MTGIRHARYDDCAAINAIYNHYVRTSPCTFDLDDMADSTREAWFRAREGEGLPVLVIEQDGRVAGWAALSPWSAKGAYRTTVEESIYLAPEMRGQGLGRPLLSVLLEAGRAAGKHVVMAGVVACQEQSLALHRTLGFEDSALNRHMGFKLGEWHDVIYLQYHLWRTPNG
jgi:phosphinothricin acetyltransferase